MAQPKEGGVELASSRLRGPINRAAPDATIPPTLTVCQGAIGMHVQVLRFGEFVQRNPVFSGTKWGPVLGVRIRTFSMSDLMLMQKASEELPKGAGGKPPHTHMAELCHVAHYRRAGLDLSSGNEPTAASVEWVGNDQFIQ